MVKAAQHKKVVKKTNKKWIRWHGDRFVTIGVSFYKYLINSKNGEDQEVLIIQLEDTTKEKVQHQV